MNNLSGLIVRALACAAVVASLSGCGTQSVQFQTSTNAESAPRIIAAEKKLESEFEKTSTMFLDAVVAGKPGVILGLWSKDGVVQGIDGPTTSGSQIKKQFDEKIGMYCLMFDTDCLRKQPGFERQYSYRDLLSKVTTRKVKRRVVRYPDGLMGELRVELDGGPVEEVRDRNPFEVAFAYENGEWKLATLP
jgi:hypothetical protein